MNVHCTHARYFVVCFLKHPDDGNIYVPSSTDTFNEFYLIENSVDASNEDKASLQIFSNYNPLIMSPEAETDFKILEGMEAT